MTKLEKCQMAIEKGIKYDSNTGQIFGVRGNEMINIDRGYNRINMVFNNKKYQLKAHQFAWYWVNKEVVDCLDHINSNRADNRICNLRSVTQQENAWNYKGKGYSFKKDKNKFRAYIKINKKSKHLGYFDNEEDARAAYLIAKENYHKIQ
jgi:hypothetical protein